MPRRLSENGNIGAGQWGASLQEGWKGKELHDRDEHSKIDGFRISINSDR